MMQKPKIIGLIGIGLLGSALAERLLRAGYSVIGFDNDPSRTDAFLILGGQGLGQVKEVARACSVILLCLPTSGIALDVVNEMLNDLGPGTLIIDTTTGAPGEMIEIGTVLAPKQVGYVDACIAGSSAQVRDGSATMIIGGETSHVQSAIPLLQCFGEKMFHLGPVGSGAKMKLVFNLVLGLNRAVLAEGLGFAKACGVDPVQALAVLRAGVAFSKVMDTKGTKMLQGDFAAQAKLSQHLKDVHLILAEADRFGAHTPLSRLHAKLLEHLCGEGMGEWDNAAIIRAFSQLEPDP